VALLTSRLVSWQSQTQTLPSYPHTALSLRAVETRPNDSGQLVLASAMSGSPIRQVARQWLEEDGSSPK
jgi:hypothetical protein